MTEPQRSLLPVLVTEQLERAANRALRYAPLTRLQLRPLQGRTLALELQRPPLRLRSVRAPHGACRRAT